MILQKLQSIEEASWLNTERLKMQRSDVAGKMIRKTGMPAAGPRWITARSTISAVTSSSTGRKG